MYAVYSFCDLQFDVILTFVSRSTVQPLSDDPVAVTVAEASNGAGGGACFIIPSLVLFDLSSELWQILDTFFRKRGRLLCTMSTQDL